MRYSGEYMLTASMSVLDIGAKRREEWLYDIYQMARDAMKAGASETSCIPTEQWDPGAAVRMVNVLRIGAVEIERATAPFMAGGKLYAAGSYVIHGAQPYLPYVRDLLNPQTYPDRRLYPDGPPEPPYDISGWTLSMQMRVRVDKVREAVAAPTEKVSKALRPPRPGRPTARASDSRDARANEATV